MMDEDGSVITDITQGHTMSITIPSEQQVQFFWSKQDRNPPHVISNMTRSCSIISSKAWWPLTLVISVAVISGSSKVFVSLNHHSWPSLSMVNEISFNQGCPWYCSQRWNKELSYSAILNVINERHDKKSAESCLCLLSERILKEEVNQSEVSKPSIYHSLLSTVLSVDTVNAL